MKVIAGIALALFAGAGQAQPAIGASGWTCFQANGDASIDGDTITIDSGSDRTLVFTIGRGFNGTWDVTQIDIGGVSPTGRENHFFSTNSGHVVTAVWSESAIGSMTGSTIEYLSTATGGNVAYCYGTLTNSSQSGLSTFTHFATAEVASDQSLDVVTTSTADDFVCVAGLLDDDMGNFDTWDTLSERSDRSTGQGHRHGFACGTGGDSPTTVTINTTAAEMMLASMVFSEPSEACVPCAYYYYSLMNRN